MKVWVWWGDMVIPFMGDENNLGYLAEAYPEAIYFYNNTED